MSRYRFRRFWIAAHRYAGLTIGLLVVIIGLSGSVAVVWSEATQLFWPQYRIADPAQDYAPYQKVMEALHAAQPQRTEHWWLNYPYKEDRHTPIWAVYEMPEERAAFYESPLYVAINPYTAQVMGQFYWGSTPPTWIYNLHSTLQLAETGEHIVGWSGVGLLLLSLSGLYLWWPLGKFTRRQFATIPGATGGRFEFHLHKLFGFYFWLVLLAVSTTGIIIVWPHAASRAMGVVQSPNAPLIDEYVWPKATPVAGAAAVSLDAAVAKAKLIFPDAEVRNLLIPAAAGRDAYGITLRTPAERFNRMYPETRVSIDPYSGEVVGVLDATEFNLSRLMLGYMNETIHSGSAFGRAGSTVMFISGFLPLFFYFTGIRQWLRSRRDKTRSARPGEPPDTG